jgi:hypothetical protein
VGGFVHDENPAYLLIGIVFLIFAFCLGVYFLAASFQ